MGRDVNRQDFYPRSGVGYVSLSEAEARTRRYSESNDLHTRRGASVEQRHTCMHHASPYHRRSLLFQIQMHFNPIHCLPHPCSHRQSDQTDVLPLHPLSHPPFPCIRVTVFPETHTDTASLSCDPSAWRIPLFFLSVDAIIVI